MPIPLNFLEAARNRPIAKQYTSEGVVPYPNVKKLTSHTYYVEPNANGLDDALQLFRSHARQGHAFLKGNLLKPLENESRANQVAKHDLTQLLVIDIDALPVNNIPGTPITAAKLEMVANEIRSELPDPLPNVSCIAHAGSSMGLDEDKVSMHLIFMLSRAVGPQGMKEWLTSLNFSIQKFSKHLTLSKQNHNLKYLIDPALANNTHLLLIANPTFSGIDSPFDSGDDRWTLIEGQKHTVDLVPLLSDVCPEQNNQQAEKILNEVRKKRGLPKFKPQHKTMLGKDGNNVQVISNPDKMIVEYAYENDEFVYFNVNGGDSNAYFVPKHNPDIVYNFKNEPYFELAKASPSIYDWFQDKYAETIRQFNGTTPVIIRDFYDDKHYACDIDVEEDRVERMAEIQRSNVSDWLAGLGHSVPDPIETWDIRFDPQSDEVYLPQYRVLNLYQKSDYLRKPPQLLDKYYVKMGEAKDALSEICPSIFKIIYHIVGSMDYEFEYFINWLAAAFQLRAKLTTTWVFSGVPGTGKGVFYDKILRPLIGEDYADRKRIDHLEDKFNAYLEKTLFMVYDEFRLSDSKQDMRILNHIKDELVAETGTIRGMRNNPVTRQLYTNYLFFSNHTDAIRIEEGDRRFNIAPPQNKKLFTVYPELEKEMDRLQDELPQFASFIINYQYNEHCARTVLENDAKESMKEAALGWHEQFCLALRRGDIDYFIDDIMFDFQESDVSAVFLQKSAQKIVAHWIESAIKQEQIVIPVVHLHTVYSALAPQQITSKKFATLLTRNDVLLDRFQVNGKRERSTITTFFSKARSNKELQELINHDQKAEDNKQWQPNIH